MIYTSPLSGPSEPNSVVPKPGRWQRFLAFPITRIVLYLLLFAAITTALLFALTGILHLLHHRRGQDPAAVQTAAEGIMAASAVLAFWVMVRFADKRPWAAAGFNMSALPTGLGGGFALGAAIRSPRLPRSMGRSGRR